MQQGAVFRAIAAVQNASQGRQHVVECDVGGEAEAATVDADQWHARSGERSCCGEQGAIAADHDRQVSFGADALKIGGRYAVQIKALVGVSLDQHAQTALCQKAHQLQQLRAGAGAGELADDCGGLKGLHASH